VPADGRAAWCARVGAQPRRWQGGGRLRGARPGRAAPAGVGAAGSPPCRSDGRRRAGRAARRIGHIPDQVGTPRSSGEAPVLRREPRHVEALCRWAGACATARTTMRGGSGGLTPPG